MSKNRTFIVRFLNSSGISKLKLYSCAEVEKQYRLESAPSSMKFASSRSDFHGASDNHFTTQVQSDILLNSSLFDVNGFLGSYALHVCLSCSFLPTFSSNFRHLTSFQSLNAAQQDQSSFTEGLCTQFYDRCRTCPWPPVC